MHGTVYGPNNRYRRLEYAIREKRPPLDGASLGQRSGDSQWGLQ